VLEISTLFPITILLFSVAIKRFEFTVNRNGTESKKISPVISYNDVRKIISLYSFQYTKIGVSFIGSRDAEVKFEKNRARSYNL
jgi:putative ABC transport system permease protein